jgi:O-antigen ligase
MALVDMIWSRNTPEQKGVLPRGVRRFVLCLAPVIIVLNLTRGDWLGFLLSIGVLLLLGRQLLPLSRKVGLIGVMLVLIPIMCVGVYMLAPEEILDQRVGKTATIYARLGAWQLLLQEFVNEPILGHGFNNARDFLASRSLQFEGVNSVRHAHNTFLAFLYELGVAGLFAYLAVVGSIAHMGLKLYQKGHIPQDRWLGIIVVAIMVAYLVPAFFGTTLYLTVISHIYVYAFVGGIAGLYRQRWAASEMRTLAGQTWRPKVGTPAGVVSNSR